MGKNDHMTEQPDRTKYILAMYDIRGKQGYIYKSNKIREIVGGSWIIRDCFEDCLFPAAKQCSPKGIFTYKDQKTASEADAFTLENFEKHLSEGYIGEVIYDGGGNFFVLFKDVNVYREVNRRFYRRLLKRTYSLRVLTSYITNLNFDDYKEDRERLYAEHRRREQKESMISPVNTLPIVQTDYRTSLPLAEMQQIGKKQDTNPEKVTYESKKKYEKYEREATKTEVHNDKLLDNMITEKGEESLLAVIYIDGNNMGAQVEACLSDLESKSYEVCTKALRKFSEGIQKHYIDNRIKEMDEILEASSKPERRFVVAAGDEITFVCNARNAYQVAVEYLKKLAEDSDADTPRTSCAGIAIFHSHAPYMEAYRIAEECCESGKQLMKREGMENVSLIDFHYCQGAFGTSLEEIRKEEETTDCSKPWFVVMPENENADQGDNRFISVEIVQEMQEMLQKAGRSNIKNLAFAAKKSTADFQSEIERIRAHQKKEQRSDFTLDGKLTDPELQRKLIYDMAIVYDLWFDEKGEV